MNLSFVDERYRTYSGKTSEIVRSLGFAALGIFWIFTDEGKSEAPDSLSIAVVFVILSMSSDILQYAYGVFIWHRFLKVLNKQGAYDHEENFLAPGEINWCANILFVAKVLFMLLAYFAIVFFMAQRFAGSSTVQFTIGAIFIGFSIFILILLGLLARTIKAVDSFERHD